MRLSTTNNLRAERASLWFRDRRSSILRDLISEIATLRSEIRILDLGGRHEFWERVGTPFLRNVKATVTVLNLDPTEARVSPEDQDIYSYVIGNACATNFADHEFDLAVSNSVIEHVGLWPDMVAFASETRRVSHYYYCQTPNFWFPIDPHFYKMPFFQFYPRPMRAWMLRTFRLATSGKAKSVSSSFEMVDSARLLTKSQLEEIFPDAAFKAERFGPFVKSYTAIRRPSESGR